MNKILKRVNSYKETPLNATVGNHNTFCSNMKQLREASGISQSELAERLNLDRTAISHYEAGTRIPSLDILIAISDYLNITLDKLVR